MDFYRIGDKMISRKRFCPAWIEFSPSEVREIPARGSRNYGVDRSFISRLETLGEMRKAKQIGVVGFLLKQG